MKDKNLYICHTVYHFLIAFLKIDQHQNDDFMICTQHINANEIISKLVNTPYVKHIYTFSEDEDLNSKYLNTYDNIYIFNDFTKIGDLLRSEKIAYHLIEDGYNFQNHIDYIYKKYLSPYSYLGKIRRFLFKKYVPFGYSKYCQSIEVNDKSKIKKDRRYFKFKEVPRKELFDRMTGEKRQLLLDIFKVQAVQEEQRDRSLLLLTQPLYEDSIIDFKNIEDQVLFYKKICDEYREDYTVFIKIHPRDKGDYSIIQDVAFLDKDVPMEVYELIGYTFKVGVTYSSTALNYLSSVEKKVFLEEVFYEE